MAFGDALIRAADVAIAMRKPETQTSGISLSSGDSRQRDIKFQKYRDGELPIYQISLKWDVDKGVIEEYTKDTKGVIEEYNKYDNDF